MSQAINIRLGPFLGEKSSLDSRYTPKPYAGRSHNVLSEDGSLRPRRGWTRYCDSPVFDAGNGAGSVVPTACTLFKYVTGVVGGEFYDEYIAIRRHGPSVTTNYKLFRFDADCGEPTDAVHPPSGFPNDAPIGKRATQYTLFLDTPTAGTYTLTVGGQTTSAIAYNAGAATIQAALVALSNVATGDVTVTAGSDFLIVFGGQWNGKNPAMAASFSLTSAPAAALTNTVVADPVKLDEGWWDCFVWDGKAVIYNPDAGTGGGSGADDDPVIEYTVGDYDSLRAIKPPATPIYSDNKIGVVYRHKASSDTATYPDMLWGGAAAAASADGTVLVASDVSNRGQQMIVAQSSTNLGVGWVKIDMNALTVTGNRDWTYNDVFYTYIAIEQPDLFQMEPNSLKIYVENATGTVQELDTDVQVQFGQDANNSTQVIGIHVYAKFAYKATRSTWATTQYIKIEWQVTKVSATDSENTVRISKLTVGGIVDWGAVNDRFEAFHGVFQLGYGYSDSTTGLVSGVAGALACSRAELLGQAVPAFTNKWLGSIPYLTIPASSDSSVTHIKIYERRRKTSGDSQVVMSEWRLIDTIADPGTATANYTFGATEKDFNDATPFTQGDFQYSDIVKAKPLHGCVLYGYRNQRQNLRWTAVNGLYVQAALDGSNVDIDDPNRGANFTLSDDQEDTPVDFWAVGQVTIILGEKGAHFQVGTKPATMTFPRRVNGAPGCLGRHASTPWKDENGTTGVAYVARDGKSAWFLYAVGVSDLESIVQARELTMDERGALDFHVLLRNPGINGNVMAMNSDRFNDALWINYSSRAMVSRRASLVDGKRQFEHYAYGNGSDGAWTGETWDLYSFDQDRGIKAMTADGIVDALEYDPFNYFAEIGGEYAEPTSVNATADTMFFDVDPVWPAAMPIVATANSGGLVLGVTYFVRAYGTVVGTYAVYASIADAYNSPTTAKVNLVNDGTLAFRPKYRDNGNAVLAGSMYWQSGTVNLAHEYCALRADVYRKRLISRPSVQLWANRNPESSARQLASGDQAVRQWPTTQGAEFRVTVYLEDNSAPVFYVDQWITRKGRRTGI